MLIQIYFQSKRKKQNKVSKGWLRGELLIYFIIFIIIYLSIKRKRHQIISYAFV